MCKHAAHTTDKENSWIEYFLYDMNKDDIDFPALSARVQDGRRGKASVFTTPPTAEQQRSHSCIRTYPGLSTPPPQEPCFF